MSHRSSQLNETIAKEQLVDELSQIIKDHMPEHFDQALVEAYKRSVNERQRLKLTRQNSNQTF